MNVKKMDRDATLKAIELLNKRIEFNNELNKMARKFMKERGLNDWHVFNGYHDAPTAEMQETLWNFLDTASDWMSVDLRHEYEMSCSAIFGQVYGPHVNTYVRNDLKDCEKHLAEIERAAQARTEEFDAFTVKRDLASNRLNLMFDYVPTPEVRSLLKRNGFKWSPYLNAWTRQLTANAEKSLERIKQEMEVL